ncbi:hypothetical protein BT69DRAFT_1278012 [Atractiella rhizophila]|nr:hypothetical protein BT69DRAFT_1278012 [Atractiella rhizophila]
MSTVMKGNRPVLDEREIAILYIGQPGMAKEDLRWSDLAQVRHRISLVQNWGIEVGEKILEIGCGQGDCSVVLTAAVKGGVREEDNAGHVTAIDPAPGDYGSPWTLKQAQDHLVSSTALAPHLQFRQIGPIEHFASLPKEQDPYDATVLCHCSYYFESPSVLANILSAAKSKTKRIYFAEYALRASKMSQVPHVLSVLAQGALEAFLGEGKRQPNVRTTFTPNQVKETASKHGWKVAKEGIFTPIDDLQDGIWELDTVVDKDWAKDILQGDDEKKKAVIQAARDAVFNSFDTLGWKQGDKRHGTFTTMDVWWAVFEEVAE